MPTDVHGPRRSTAWHEAGHAAAAVVLGLGCRYVTVVPVQGYRGRAVPRSWCSERWVRRAQGATIQGTFSFVPAVRPSAEARRHAIASLAGAAAEELVRHRRLLDAPPWLYAGWAEDYARARALLKAARLGAGQHFEAVVRETRALVRRERGAIAGIAEALLDRRILTGEQVLEIVNAGSGWRSEGPA